MQFAILLMMKSQRVKLNLLNKGSENVNVIPIGEWHAYPPNWSEIFENLKKQHFSETMTKEKYWLECLKDYAPVQARMRKSFEAFKNHQDIEYRKRYGIDENGNKVECEYLPNEKIALPGYRKLVRQKKNYLFGKPFYITSENEKYNELLSKYNDKSFRKFIQKLGQNVYVYGIAWAYPYYDAAGKLKFKTIHSFELCPVWNDDDHEELDRMLHQYAVTEYVNGNKYVKYYVDVYDDCGVWRYETNEMLTELKPRTQEEFFTPYLHNSEKAAGWEKGRVPFIAFKYNEEEQSLYEIVKSIANKLNDAASDLANSTEDDQTGQTYVLKGATGTDMKTFRKNLTVFGAVSLPEGGELSTLEHKSNSETLIASVDKFSEMLISYGHGFDTKRSMGTGTPNEMTLKSMYNDIDQDADDVEAEFNYKIDELLWYVDFDLANKGKGDFSNEEVEIKFNRNMIMLDSETIKNIGASDGLVSNETLLRQHPYVQDVDKELERIKKEKEEEEKEYDPYNNVNPTATLIGGE